MIRIVTPSLAYGPTGTSTLFTPVDSAKKAAIAVSQGRRVLVPDRDTAIDTLSLTMWVADAVALVDNALRAIPEESVS